jgi:protein TonB
MTTLQELRPIHGKPVKQNKSVGLILSTAVTGSVLFAVYVGLNRNLVLALVEDIQAVVVTEEVKNEAPPPPLPPDFKPPTVTAIAPEVTINLAAVRTPPAAITVTAPPPPAPPKPVIAAPPPPPPPPPPAPVRVGGAIRPPTKVKDVRPVYPAIAQSARVQGVVIIEATIGPTGTVQDAKVLRSIPLLDAAALDAVRQWQFTPTTLNGVPVPVIMTVTVNFTLQ